MIWIYALAEHPHVPPPRRRGLAQAPLEGIPTAGMLAVVTRHAHAPAEPAPDALWVHERVVERVMADRAVLPMRFGTVLENDAALAATVEPRAGELLAALDRVRGRVEIGVRAIALTNGELTAGEPATGRDYLLAKLAGDRRADAVHTPLAALAVDHRRFAPRSGDEVLRAAYLIDRAGVARFRATVERLQQTHPDLAVLCTGPWPPYAFTAPRREAVPA